MLIMLDLLMFVLRKAGWVDELGEWTGMHKVGVQELEGLLAVNSIITAHAVSSLVAKEINDYGPPQAVGLGKVLQPITQFVVT